MRRFNTDRPTSSPPTAVVPIKPRINLTPITASTKLVNSAEASRLLLEEKGIRLSVQSISERCKSGRWLEGYHWVKPSRTYSINMQAVYESIAAGSL